MPSRSKAHVKPAAASRPDKSLPPRHAQRVRTHRLARGVALVTTAVVAFTGTLAAAVYHDFNQIDRTDVSGHVPQMSVSANPDDPYAGKALNILVMGTDLRDAENVAIAGKDEGGARSDSTLLVHISGDRTRIEVVSIPRDSLVDIPACDLPGGKRSQPRNNAMFNSAFQIGAGAEEDLTLAAACTITTVYSLTGVPITNHVVVKMTGVIGVVDALGGVPMCIPERVRENPKYGTLDLQPGKQTFDGRTAINYLRARHGKGMGLEEGTDLTRIERQQAFVDATMREILSQNLVTNSPRLYQVIQAALKALSADPKLADPKALAGLAYSLRNIDPAEIVFTELPVVYSKRQKGRVEWNPEADEIWQRLIADEPPQAPEATASTQASGEKGGSAGAGGTTTSGSSQSLTSPGTGAATGSAPATGATPTTPAKEELLPGVCSD